jgi:hypothetical protein
MDWKKLALLGIGVGAVGALTWLLIQQVWAKAKERLFLVVRGSDGGPIYYKEAGEREWTYLGGETIDGSGVSAVLKGNLLHILVQGAEGGIYYGNVNVDTKTFSGFGYVPGGYSKPQTPALA